MLKNVLLFALLLSGATIFSQETTTLDSLFPVRGFCIAAPRPAQLDSFIGFIHQELAPRHVNTLVLRIQYNYQFESHPELRDSVALSKRDVQKLLRACREHQIRIIPLFNLLGHQSWAGSVHNLLLVYPEFDETPWVQMPETYAWPNPDGLYCKSYCPLHPEVHRIAFDLVDELCTVFEADAFHAGMDEVFYLGEDKCPRCSGRDKAELFAGEVNLIRNHLQMSNRKLWIWGKSLIEGKTTRLGLWEASYNNTHRAIDLIYKDITICDWHYERPDQTAVYFAMKGFDVVTCPWRRPDVAVVQAQDILRFRQSSTPEMKERFRGLMQTIWSGAEAFLNEFYGKTPPPENAGPNTQANCFRALFEEIDSKK